MRLILRQLSSLNLDTEFGLHRLENQQSLEESTPFAQVETLRVCLGVWLEGADIWALLSTGNQTWYVLVKSQRPMVFLN